MKRKKLWEQYQAAYQRRTNAIAECDRLFLLLLDDRNELLAIVEALNEEEGHSPKGRRKLHPSKD